MENKKDRSNAKYQSKSKRRKSFSDDKRRSNPDEVKNHRFNDPAWYVANGQLVKDFASLSFNNALGGVTRLDYDNGSGDYGQPNYMYTAPGIMSIVTAPSFGISKDGSSALNVASKTFYTNTRYKNSGHSNYDAPDQMLYFGAMDSIYSVLASMIRAYGTARAFSQVNRYIGDAMLRTQGFDPAEIRANMADFRGYINMVIAKLNAFCTPVTMTMYKRHFWMYSGMYRDEDFTKSQTYQYVPGVIWAYEEMSGPGYLKAIPLTVSLTNVGLTFVQKSVTQWRTILDDLIARVVNSEDINIMSGDVLKAYGEENLWKLSPIPEDYVIMPIFSQEVLDQIHNTSFAGSFPVSTLDLTTVPSMPSLERLNVIHDPEVGDGALYFAPQFLNAAHLGYNLLVDVHSEFPTPEEVIVSTRNMLHADVSKIGPSESTNSLATLDTAGCDIPLFAFIGTLAANAQGINFIKLFANQNEYTTNVYSVLSKFNKYPHFVTVDQASRAIQIWGELDNYTVIDSGALARMHDTALLSLLGVPYLGT